MEARGYPGGVDPFLVIGLGNPGPEYAGNRHNVGAMVVAELARRSASTLRRHKARAYATDVRLGLSASAAAGAKAIVAQPTSFMNVSGGPVKALLQYYSLDLDRLIVVHDELDIPFGQVRLKFGGGEGGHNGLKSISSAVGSRDYARVRVGIGRPPGRQEPADYVLRNFPVAQRIQVELLIDSAADAVELLANEGIAAAQQVVHAPS